MESSNNEQEMRARFKRAGEIVKDLKDLPEAVQAVAFQRALDELSGNGPSPAIRKKTSAQHKDSPANANLVEQSGSRALLVESQLNSTEHPEIDDSLNVLDRSLFILKAAKDKCGIDGLTPGEIAQVLTNKFRVRTGDAAVRMALLKERKLVDRRSEGRGFVYLIMSGGEKHLESLRTQTRAPASPKKVRKTASKNTHMKTKKTNQRSTGGRPGPKKILEELAQDGFFDSPQTLATVINHIKDNRGYLFKSTDLSPALSRLLRQGQLTRSRNKESQYEYTRKR